MMKIKRKFFLKLLLLSVWFSFFLSINLNPIEFLDFNLINKVRIILPLALTFLLISLRYNEIKLSNIFNKNLFVFYLICFLYIIFTISFQKNNMVNIFWPLYMMLSFFVLHNLTNYEEKKDILILTILIISFGFIFYFSSGLIQLAERADYHFYGIMGAELGYLGISNPPRSSGLARLAIILFSFLIYYYLIKEKKNNYLILILICALGTFSLIFQSRTVSFIYIILLIFNVSFYFKKFFKDKWLVVFAVILPLLINFIYNYNLITKNKVLIELGLKSDKSEMVKQAMQNVLLRDYYFNKINPNNFSSNRYKNWNTAINIIKKDYLRGYGAQADRILIDQSIHNSFLYSVLSGGILSGLSIIFIYIYSIILLIKFYLTGVYKMYDSPLVHFAGSILIIIGLRSVLETSFAVFSIDFLVFIIAFLFLKECLKKYQ